MWTGTSALKSIDQTLQTIRNDAVRLDNQLTQLTESLASNQRRRIQIINEISMIRLTEIERGDLSESLTSADRQALAVLAQRESALSALNTEIDRLNQQILDAETQREQMLADVNAASQKLVDIEAEVQAQLKRDQAYLNQFVVAGEAESVAEEASRKVEQAQLDMADKAKPYQDDELFMYLWNRGYGTTDYSGGLFSRFIDGWVARVIKYQPARVNYWNLTEIPQRLAEHADRVDNIAGEAHMALQQLELEALEQAGATGLEAQLGELRTRLDEFDDQVEDYENDLNAKLKDRARFAAGDDDYLRRCIEQLTQALQHQDLQSVHRYVRATTSPTDDQLVIELRSVDDQLDDASGDLADVRAMYDNKIDRLKQLESVRRNFKNSRFDDVRSGFANKSVLAGVLGQFLQGVVSGSDLWRVIQRNQRYRNVGSVPDFGSGGLGDILGGGRIGSRRRTHSRRNSTWHWPTPRRGGGGFRAPRRSSGGGGFNTGGGF